MPSPLKEKLSSDLKQALKSGDQVRLSVVRMLISGIEYRQIAKRGEIFDKMQKAGHTELTEADVKEISAQSEPTDDDVIAVISREMKQHRESIEAFRAGNRPELVDKEEAELAVLQSYAPQQMSRPEIMELSRKIIDETGARGPRDKGKVMGKLMPLVRGKADGQEVNAVVNELLGS